MDAHGKWDVSGRSIALIALIFSIFAILSLVYNLRRIQAHTIEKAVTEARTVFDINLAYRRWNAGHGGVYVPVTAAYQPNPYLSNHPRRDVVTTDGTSLTLVNPAMMTRHVHRILSSGAALPVINKVTSLKYVNPENMPDEWEAKALRSFDEGGSEASELVDVNGQPYLRLLKPYMTEKGCLVCHAAQGYKLGDVRGGLSVGIPMKAHLEQASRERMGIYLSHLLVWCIGMTGIALLGVLIRAGERKLIVEKEFTDAAINTMPGVFLVVGEDGGYLRWNKAVEAVWGEINGNPPAAVQLSMIHPDDREMYAGKMSEAFRSGFFQSEVRMLTGSGGAIKDYYLTGKTMELDGRTYLVHSGIDITDRKAMEEQIGAAAVEWRRTFNAINDCIMILDRDFRILQCNEATVALTGKSSERIIGSRCWEIMHGSAGPAGCPVGHMMTTRKRETAVLDILGKSCRVTADPIFDDDGNIKGIVHSLADISEQKKLEMQLHQAQKMEAIGVLAGGVAHDFNNILSAIIGCASIMQLKINPDDPLWQYTEQIMASTERAVELTKSLLAFSRKERVELKPVDINEIVRGFQKILSRLIGEDVEFVVTCLPDVLSVEADKGQIEQVLMNLATNARDAMPKGGRLQIATERVMLENVHGDLANGTYAVISVSDTGSGMGKETQEHIFEPFFTTKETGKGTGLGLSIVYGIVSKHNGTIHVYSEKGMGTTFKIFLPMLPSAPTDAAVVANRAPALPTGSETILLAEDDAITRGVAKALLEEFGYTVLEAGNGEEAVSVFMENRDRIHLLLSDLIMPKMNGKEAYEEIRKVSPDIRTIFMSGYTLEIIEQKGIFGEGLNFVAKPLNPAELLGKIRAVLD